MMIRSAATFASRNLHCLCRMSGKFSLPALVEAYYLIKSKVRVHEGLGDKRKHFMKVKS